ncbi:MAG TPA: hypothetical protein VKY85_11980 [Candidatus Angelobacter sp.]|nr:hypothetical protein [Candidatus Angelobacter sp.]
MPIQRFLPIAICFYFFTIGATAQTLTTGVAGNMPSENQPLTTIAELQVPRAVILKRVVKGLNARTKTSAVSDALTPYRRGINAMFMWTSTDNFIAKFIDNSGTVGNSDIFDSSGLVGIGTTNPQATLHVAGDGTPGLLVEAQDAIEFGTTVCCGAGPTGSSLGSSAGWSSFYNGVFLNSNGTATGVSTGAQINTSLPSWRMALGSGSNEWPGGDNFAIARVAAGGTYSSPSVLFSISDTGRMKVAGGVDATGGGIKHMRVTGCTIPANSNPPTCSQTIEWPSAFSDANYTFVCTASGSVPTWSNRTSSGVTLGFALQQQQQVNVPIGEVDCIAMHD